MNKVRRTILKCLYDLNKARASIFRSLKEIKDYTGIGMKEIERETDYLSQKGFIEKQLITTLAISAYSCRITAQGIDLIESHKFLIFLKIIKKFWLVIAVLIPLLGFYLDFLGLKTKFFALFTGKPQTLITKEQPVIPQPIQKAQDAEKEIKQKIAKVQISRIIEDATSWLEGRIKQNMPDIEKIKNNFNSRNIPYSGMHITAHINRVNSLINSVNGYIKDMNRKIEDILLNLEEERLESVVWLKDEYKRYIDFLDKVKVAKNSIKQQNDGVCLRFIDKTTFDNILKANPYKE